MNRYPKPLDLVNTDAGKQFRAKTFKQYIANTGIIVKNFLVEAYYFINMVERYHGLLEQVFSVINIEILITKLDLAIQISFKAINNFVSSNLLISTLLVFGKYLRITEQDALSLSNTMRAVAMQKTMNEEQKFTVSGQINYSLNART